MASLLSFRRASSRRPSGPDDEDIELTATLTADPHAEDQQIALAPSVGWVPIMLVGVLITAACGWVIVSGLTVLGWLAGTSGTLSGALLVGTQLWLLANGAGAELGGITWTVTPLALSMLIAFLISRFAAIAARQHQAGDPARSDLAVTARVTLVAGCGYGLLVAATALGVGAPLQAARGLLGGLLIAAVGAALGAARALCLDVGERLPGWARPVPAAVVGAQCVLVVAGAAVMVGSLVLHLGRVVRLSDSLHAGLAGGIAMLVAQLAFVPNVVLWAGSFALGAGFSVGPYTLVAPAASMMSVLPPFPLLGALPAGGGGTWQLAWVAAGVVAGGYAAWQVVRRRPAARLDETCLVGGLTGVLAGLVFVLLGWLSGGNLGDVRLAGVGPRLPALLVMAVSTLGLSGMVCGLLLGLARLLRRPRS